MICDSLDKKVNSIVIDGVLDVRENPISVNDFLDKFIEWIEENHWYFGGTTREYIEDEEEIIITKENNIKYCNKCGHEMAKGLQSSLFGDVKIYFCPNCGNMKMEVIR